MMMMMSVEWFTLKY